MAIENRSASSLPSLTLHLDLKFNGTADDAWGNWQYAAAEATAGDTEVKLAAMKRDNSSAAVGIEFPASILTGTVMFQSSGTVPEFLTFQGVHDLKTNDEWGTITAASPGYRGYVGGSFTFSAADLRLTIEPPDGTGR